MPLVTVGNGPVLGVACCASERSSNTFKTEQLVKQQRGLTPRFTLRILRLEDRTATESRAQT